MERFVAPIGGHPAEAIEAFGREWGLESVQISQHLLVAAAWSADGALQIVDHSTALRPKSVGGGFRLYTQTIIDFITFSTVFVATQN